MTKKSIKKQIKAIKKSNKEFAKSSKAEQRVRIALDVIAQLKAKKIVATSGTWLERNDGEVLISAKGVNQNVELQKEFKKMPTCNACALGAMFVCGVKRFDNFKALDMQDARNSNKHNKSEEDKNYHFGASEVDLRDIRPFLKRYFDDKQLGLIECAFEGGHGGYPMGNTSGKLLSKASEFEIIDEADDRMIAIMKNIIKNNGTFVPELPPDMKKKYDQMYGEDDGL